jgi:hypothetical protein
LSLQNLLSAEGFADEPETTTFESSPDEIDFENTTGLAKKYLSLTIEELVKVKGGVSNLKQWTGILKDLKAIEKTEQDLMERRNQLIEKDFAVSNLKKYVDLFMEELFNSAEAQTETIISYVLADTELARKKIPTLRQSSYTKISKNTKKSIHDSLKRLKKKYDVDPS